MTTKEKLEKAMKAMQFCCQSPDDMVRIQIAKAGFCLDELLNDKNPFVRRAIVDNGYRLNKFLYDDDFMVREGVAKKGFGTDVLMYDQEWKIRKIIAALPKLTRNQINILAKDPAPEVRLEIAKRGQKLSILVNDPSVEVRKEVANQGYKLEELIKDQSPVVRAVVASKGFGLKKLLNDSDPAVVRAAQLYGFQHDATSVWKMTRNFRICQNCGNREPKHETPTKRCPKCHFIMENFYEINPTRKPKKASE